MNHGLATSRHPTLCLNMIVRNEAANLERCLRSVADHISCWVIGDTGSTDGTPELIERFFAGRGIPGELHRFAFENFAQARNEALDRARASGLRFDYLLLTDADMELRVDNPAFARDLTEAAYKLRQHSGVTYWNNRLLRRDVPASYKGVTHEYLDVRSGRTASLEGAGFIDHASGSNRVDKYERDIRLLTTAIAAERDRGMIARYTFYLANTFRDSGRKDAALTTYLERARQGHWQQEVFLSLVNAAQLKEALGYANGEVIDAYMQASAACPARAEALHGAARFCRIKGFHERGYQFAMKGLEIAYPADALFVQDWVYHYGLLDELAVTAYWTHRYAVCAQACDRLLNEGKLPAAMRERVLKNQRFAIDKLATASPSATTGRDATACKIPRTFHFITGLDAEFGGMAFSFVHYMAVVSALRVNKGFEAKIYYHYEPTGPYWDRVKHVAELVRVDLPTEVFGNPLEHFAHKADVLRLRLLLEHGGIYLDLDTICQRPFEPLLDGRVVLGREERVARASTTSSVGLCNATIIAPKGAEFLRLWFETYRDFTGGTTGDAWNRFSVQIPMALARDHPDLLHIEPATSFFWPSWDRDGLESLFARDMDFPAAFCFHLWESQSWRYLKELDADAVTHRDTTYNRIARRFIAADPEVETERRSRQPRDAARFCLFTSAGDRHAIDHWVSPEQNSNSDLITVYYGDDDHEFARLAGLSTRSFRNKASKFQNLRHALNAEPTLLDNYDYVWVCDDDLIMTPDQIAKTFQIAAQFEFWVCQPAFAEAGKISWQATRQHNADGIRIVNFVEMTCPLFRADKLAAFMRVYDGSLAGWGIDFWYCNLLGARQNARFAVIDSVVVVNPKDEDKAGQFREIDRLQSAQDRREHWITVRDRLGLDEYSTQTYWHIQPDTQTL